jgi:four helix bundle protein
METVPRHIAISAISRSKEPRDICARSVAYALRAIKLYQVLQARRDGAGWILGKQYLRCATSIGANVEEAQAGESRPDFVHKLGIALKEARESRYWLHLLAESGTVKLSKLKPLIKETEELVAVIASIIVSTKRFKN